MSEQGRSQEKNLERAEQRRRRARRAPVANARSPATTPGCPLTARQPRLALPSRSVAPNSPETLHVRVVVEVTRLHLKPSLDWELETEFLSLIGL
jgi:hypothetical protein